MNEKTEPTDERQLEEQRAKNEAHWIAYNLGALNIMTMRCSEALHRGDYGAAGDLSREILNQADTIRCFFTGRKPTFGPVREGP